MELEMQGASLAALELPLMYPYASIIYLCPCHPASCSPRGRGRKSKDN